MKIKINILKYYQLFEQISDIVDRIDEPVLCEMEIELFEELRRKQIENYCMKKLRTFTHLYKYIYLNDNDKIM